MKALILSGGTGSRLRPLTYTNAKQTLPVANKPILFYIIEKVVHAGIRDIGIIVGDTRPEIEASVGDGNRWGVNITYIYQRDPLGLAHAVKLASDYLGNEEFLMILGDNLFQMELHPLIENFHRNEANASILLHRVEDPSRFGVAVVENGRIVRLVEKPAKFISDLIITGVYLFDHTIFAAIDKTVPSWRNELEITDAIQVLLETGGKVSYELTDGWWKDTGKLSDMLEANRLVLDGLENSIPGEAAVDVSYQGRLHIGADAILKNCTITGPVIIGPGAVIKDSILGPYTAVDSGVTIKSCRVENSIVLSGTQLLNVNLPIRDSLIGRNAMVEGTGAAPSSISFFIGDNGSIIL